MEIKASDVKALRDKTGAGFMDCKRALQEADGDVEGAIRNLRAQGMARAQKRAGRVARQGLVWAYLHAGGKIGVLLEVNCESDFVARTPEFKELVHDLAMQVVGACPRYVSPEDVPQGEEFADEDCLLLQPFIKDPGKRVQDVVTETIAKVRENIKVRRFVRFALGSDGQDE